MRVNHGSCGRSWWQSGNRTSHCGGCHETFATLTAFDRHRRGGECLDPRALNDAEGSAVFAAQPGSHGFDDAVTYWTLPSDPFDAAAVFGHVDSDAWRSVGAEGYER